ncbi:hypothetical protein [Larkinella rosea]|uniref:hypothetical protein n=1 Tax=Larkinella rosea TaxID=2025312 RepID=UPI001C898D7B|nr:hypothetical protein [Larkinella rosea]
MKKGNVKNGTALVKEPLTGQTVAFTGVNPENGGSPTAAQKPVKEPQPRHQS